MILAITENSLYQFTGESIIRSVLEDYKGDNQAILKNKLTLEVAIAQTEEPKKQVEQADAEGTEKPISLQIFYDQK